ncbi:hypothetical protein HMPREF1554_01687 [Porphyromonas gingivalis F0569]|nr:hypothetical protein HMPREF1554_01687 [Porphyromonas gingivalis F0569]
MPTLFQYTSSAQKKQLLDSIYKRNFFKNTLLRKYRIYLYSNA